MAEYISREAAVQAAKDGADEWDGGYSRTRDAYIEWSIAAVPAADVQEVVRCKDCKHSYEDLMGRCCAFGACVDCIVPDDFFCAYGVKMDESEGEE